MKYIFVMPLAFLSGCDLYEAVIDSKNKAEIETNCKFFDVTYKLALDFIIIQEKMGDKQKPMESLLKQNKEIRGKSQRHFNESELKAFEVSFSIIASKKIKDANKAYEYCQNNEIWREVQYNM
ncbi:MAG: hypothetical protein KYX62_09180 [Pseudomonadota bacterium]|nr:hypothetical protein [Pseudomonadota bacterium]